MKTGKIIKIFPKVGNYEGWIDDQNLQKKVDNYEGWVGGGWWCNNFIPFFREYFEIKVVSLPQRT